MRLPHNVNLNHIVLIYETGEKKMQEGDLLDNYQKKKQLKICLIFFYNVFYFIPI